MTESANFHSELAAKCAVLVGRLYEMHGWTWGGWRTGSYTPEAEAIAQTIQGLLDDLDGRFGDYRSLSTGRLMVTESDGDKTVYLELGYMDKHGYVSCDNDLAERV